MIEHKKINKILIANRGEIALRIIRACKELDIKSVVVFSEVDVNGVWVRKADECYPIMGDPIQAYLDYDRIISLAKKADCDAIHPGYGFLSENADFAQACADNGIIFIGPKPEHIALFGDKMASKVAMRAVGVPMLPGTDEPIDNVEDAEKIAIGIGFPVIIKAAFGGGGRGMRIVERAEDFKEMYESATQEALRFFSRGETFIEKYLKNPRHIEIQIVADKYGNVVHLGDRDCSIQRRHQKVIEIAPSPLLNEDTRRELYRISTKAMFKLGYESVGTIEYLVDQDDNIYFIEMNTRVQVEHPVTEVISGIDLIQRMIQIAEGDQLKFLQEEIKLRGYAIEFRLNAENPKMGFVPSPGLITNYLAPGGPGVRLDSMAYTNYLIPSNYDSMIGKLIVSALTWEDVVRKARRALDEFIIEGVPTNIPLHRQIVCDQDFIDGTIDTGYLDTKLQHFNLDAITNMNYEEAKMKHITSVIEAIKRNNLNVRH
ncbi:MAG: acetyl-CoA carboxylase biotin carboxylase subunit [Sulfuricurvum sp.]|uniref:acetyl-CoA carboxylase biotin carboxylase subunit n=1 Tax=Sulfuricurvum sp. TaxID=2025608 RepID=UPI0026189BE9|nr:acetyl-CoA carboxylase biotin carboxylase subunit [Sulfuricurvum sp.]MDD2829185.1 acetyl-CoA carboxylase biotin carboxylase subunit [Sulfuricurvum sp.]MDD4949018.1 acetyl-CoA carboxylase biotin carboxylase subunit [Sulfuricurvum sp.]